MQSTNIQIVDKIKKSKRGKIFFQKDFAFFGTPGATRFLGRIAYFKKQLYLCGGKYGTKKELFCAKNLKKNLCNQFIIK